MKNKSQNEIKKFSKKDYILTVLFTCMVAVFIGFTILFISVIPDWMYVNSLASANEDAEGIVRLGKNFEESLNEKILKDKEVYGEDYPSIGILLSNLTYLFRSKDIVLTYVFALLCGLILGTIFYIILIQKARGKKLIKELIIAGTIIILIVLILFFGYRYVLNGMIDVINNSKA